MSCTRSDRSVWIEGCMARMVGYFFLLQDSQQQFIPVIWDLNDNKTAFLYVIAITYPDPFALEWIWKKTQTYLICRLLFADRYSVITAALQLCLVSNENAHESSYSLQRLGTNVRRRTTEDGGGVFVRTHVRWLTVPACHYVQQRNHLPLSCLDI